MALVEILGAATRLLTEGMDLFDTDKKQKAALLLKQLDALQAQNTAQAHINAQEATHRSLFVAGWRPAIGWICAISLAFTFIAKPYLFPFLYESYPALAHIPPMDEGMLELALSILGLASLRTYEKNKGISR